MTTSQLDITNESQEVSPFPAGDHKASIIIRARKHIKNKTEITIDQRYKSISCGYQRFREDFLKFFPLFVYICQSSDPISKKKTKKHASFPLPYLMMLTKIGLLLYFFENVNGRCRDGRWTIGILKPHMSFRAHVS